MEYEPNSGSMVSKPPFSKIDYALIYDNSKISGHWYHPGDNCEILDWGISSGGTVNRFIFRYITKLPNPGQITVRFYDGSNSTICSGNSLAEYTLNGLNGSPDGGDYVFTCDFIIPQGEEFDLPKGAFEFNNNQTGVELAKGGSGNENNVWENCSGPHQCKDPNVWAGFYMEIYALEERKGNMRIEPLVLNFNCNSQNGEFSSGSLYTKMSNLKEQNLQNITSDILRYRKKYNGTGIAIAICDTGINYNHPQMGGGSFPNKKVIGGWDFGDNDADPYPDILVHGTFCAGVAAGNLADAVNYIGGVAYNAKLYSLKIKGKLTHQTNFDTLEAVLNWCVIHQYDDPNHPILVISISYGGKRSFTTCDGLVPSLTAAVNKALAAGITVLASSGNNGWINSIQCPACISDVISVGATNSVSEKSLYSITRNSFSSRCSSKNCSTDSDVANNITVIPFSNTSPILDILAPSRWNYTSDISIRNWFSNGGFGETSSACAYAAGVVACLQSAAKDILGKYLTPEEVRKTLIATGDYIFDGKANVAKPQINLDRAIDSLICNGKTFSIYNDGPGSLMVSTITSEKGGSWLSFCPKPPFVINSGEYQKICVVADPNFLGLSDRLLIFSNDPNNNPYPDAVFVNIVKRKY